MKDNMSVSLLTPIGTGIAANSSPSLAPVNGALGLDTTQAGILYIANGTLWNPVGENEITDATLSAITLTSGASNPNLTVTMYLQKQAGPSFSMVNFELDIASSITAVVPDTWVSSAGAIAAAFRPASNVDFPMYCTVAGGYEIGNARLRISTAGTISAIINFSYTSSTVVFTTVDGVYKI